MPESNEIPTIHVAEATLKCFQRWHFKIIEKGIYNKDYDNKLKRESRNCTLTSLTSLGEMVSVPNYLLAPQSM